MLTARGDDIDRILGLELGTDDYLPKLFNDRELTARIKAILRRFNGQFSSELVSQLIRDQRLASLIYEHEDVCDKNMLTILVSGT